jgi:hypothetical protein
MKVVHQIQQVCCGYWTRVLQLQQRLMLPARGCHCMTDF